MTARGWKFVYAGIVVVFLILFAFYRRCSGRPKPSASEKAPAAVPATTSMPVQTLPKPASPLALTPSSLGGQAPQTQEVEAPHFRMEVKIGPPSIIDAVSDMIEKNRKQGEQADLKIDIAPSPKPEVATQRKKRPAEREKMILQQRLESLRKELLMEKQIANYPAPRAQWEEAQRNLTSKIEDLEDQIDNTITAISNIKAEIE
ncbi:MAG: hypothetical protein A2581_02640 [Candidatus Staskawiczbacteria bacterium RIFOXYD1_FULL_37_110]|nr:MAG: hypothetical protein A2581_02640 [Candidatus Staskawiczbacteria bacterium RIFOXYD1_FULL_37_110]